MTQLKLYCVANSMCCRSRVIVADGSSVDVGKLARPTAASISSPAFITGLLRNSFIHAVSLNPFRRKMNIGITR